MRQIWKEYSNEDKQLRPLHCFETVAKQPTTAAVTKPTLLHRLVNRDSTNWKIFRAAVIVGFFTVIVKMGTTAKELVIAQSYGRGDALDAFLIAFLLPTFVLNLVMGSLGAALIPTFIEMRQNDSAGAAQKLFSSLLFLGLIILLVITCLLALFAPYYLPYLGSGFSPAKLSLTRDLLYVLLPVVFFNGSAMCASGVLNATERFALPSLAPLLTPLIVILFIGLGARRWGVFSLAAGTAAGSLLEAALLTWILKAHGMQLTPRWGGLDASVRSVLRQYAPMLAGTFLMGSTAVVDQSMAAMLRGGSVAALGYASKVIGAVSGIGAMALSTAVFPYFSRMVATKDWNGCRHTLKRFSVLIMLTTIPITAVLAIFSEPLVRLLFQRGAFSAADTKLVSWVQICYSLQIPFYIWGALFVRFLSSIRRNDLLMYCTFLSLALDVGLNLALMKVWGVAGIALSTSCVYAASFLFLSVCSIKMLAREGTPIFIPMNEQRASR